MDIAKIIILVFYLILIAIIVFFNWLYSARAIRANKQIGLYTPDYIKVLVKTSTLCAVVTAVLIVFFLGTKIY